MRLFTVEEANALLPSVKEILQKIQRSRKRLAPFRSEAQQAAQQAEHGGGGMKNGVRYANLVTDFSLAMSEMEALGVQMKDFERGLVDFPSLRDGRVVLLCWQLGEGDKLEWWHDMESGFAGRTPL